MSNLYADHLDLHDAIFEGFSVDIRLQRLTILASCYLSSEDRSRKALRFDFDGVVNLAFLLDFSALLDNIRSGNVSSWAIENSRGVAHIYFSDGYAAIWFKRLEITEAIRT